MIITDNKDSQVFFTRNQLLHRGWRRGQIKQWLDPPNKELFRDGSIVKLYSEARVENAKELRKDNKAAHRQERNNCRLAKKKNPSKRQSPNAFPPIGERIVPDWMTDLDAPLPVMDALRRDS
jgi:hypothetical protein